MKTSCSIDLGKTTTSYHLPLENVIPKLQRGLADSGGQFFQREKHLGESMVGRWTGNVVTNNETCVA